MLGLAGQPVGALALDLVAPGRAGAPGVAGFLGVGLTLAAVVAVVARERENLRSRTTGR